MSINKKIYIVSIEGNWDQRIHDRRIERAAIALQEDPSAFAIASGTFPPPSYASFFQGRLGEYTKEILINKYDISAMRIIPAYQFPYGSTYTIIDAFTNATLIGWISCGLRKRAQKICVLFEPTTTAFHGMRVKMLNTRACNYLHQLNVSVQLSCKNKLSTETLKKDYQGETRRLSEMQSYNGIITTGKWLDNQVMRSYDDLSGMKHDLFHTFNSSFDFPAFRNHLDALSDFERLIFTFSWNQLANTKQLSDKDFKNIYLHTKSNYDINISYSESLTVVARRKCPCLAQDICQKLLTYFAA